MVKRRNWSSSLFRNIFNISLTSGVKLHIHLWNVVVRYIFSSVLQIWYAEVRIPRSISESTLDFEITRIDCIWTTAHMRNALLPDNPFPVSILYKSIAGRYRPVRVADVMVAVELITTRYRFIKNASWVYLFMSNGLFYGSFWQTHFQIKGVWVCLLCLL